MSNDLVSSHLYPGRRRPLASGRLVPQELLDRQGFARGDFWLGRTLNGRPFGWYDEMNLLTCAGTGAGKGVSSVIPNLLQFPGSVVVIDPKGDLAGQTAKYRRDVLGQKVIVLDPARVADVPDDLRGTYNPLDHLDLNDPLTVTAAQTIASAIVMTNAKNPDPHFDESALDLVQSCLLYMIAKLPQEQHTLMKLRQIIALGDEDLFESYVARQREEDPTYEPSIDTAHDLFTKALLGTPNFGGIIRETASKLSRMGERERGSVFSTASRNFEFLKSPELWDVLQSNDDPARTFGLRELRRQDRPLTVYLCLPVDMMVRQGRWLRVLISQIIQFIERSPFDKTKDAPVLMLIDEFFQLGPMPQIANTLTYARSFGLRLWLIVQDLGQVKMHYPEAWETILGACGIKQFFGVNDAFTAKYVSEFLGHEEIDVPSITLTETWSESDSENTSDTDGWTRSTTIGQSQSSSEGRSTSDTVGTNHGTSFGANQGWNDGVSTSQGVNDGTSSHVNHGLKNGRIDYTKPTSGSTGAHQGRSSGTGTSSGRSVGFNQSSNWGSSESSTSGVNSSTSESRSDSYSDGSSGSATRGRGTSITKGANYAFSVAKQTRSLFRPEDVLNSFTKDNLLQLTHIRDHGGMLLFRTPFYADPWHQHLLSKLNDA